MPKRKTHKGLTKRVKITATGKVLHKRRGLGHLLSGKPGERKLNLRRPGEIKGAMAERIREALRVD